MGCSSDVQLVGKNLTSAWSGWRSPGNAAAGITPQSSSSLSGRPAEAEPEAVDLGKKSRQLFPQTRQPSLSHPLHKSLLVRCRRPVVGLCTRRGCCSTSQNCPRSLGAIGGMGFGHAATIIVHCSNMIVISYALA